MSSSAHPSGLSAEQIAELRSLATAAAERSYSPYSKFRVGAAVLLEDGSIFTGANIENASYRLTICAEHTAIAKAVNEHGPRTRIRAIAVDNLNGAASFPCGPCRQILLEFGGAKTWVFAPGKDGPADAALSELLPFGFHLDN
ncbi:MAG TPA: cytidine deaminase [Acidobacteriaceae bacterium]|jgi:cytidine deaminase|nr:cytidine deaminase [Acidobacteriaceae bacterium]